MSTYDTGAAGGKQQPKTVLDYLELAHGFLAGKQIDEARADAEVLLADSLGVKRIELYTNYERPLTKAEVDNYRETLKRRVLREPVSYIVGRREFWSLDLAVDRRVLIPRPETETLVESALEKLRASGISAPRIADIGTGCGAIAVALATEITDAHIVATDKSAATLEVAPLNARTHGVDRRIEFVEGESLAPLAGRDRFDMIVSNPPYVTELEHQTLAPEVRDWEPLGALVAGADGMSVTRALIDAAPTHLRRDGWILLEVGTQATDTAEYLTAAGWREVTVRKDLSGRPRVAEARPPVNADAK